MTSNDLKRHQPISEFPLEVKPIKSKSRLKGGANIEINDECLDELLNKNNI